MAGLNRFMARNWRMVLFFVGCLFVLWVIVAGVSTVVHLL
jgi:hypothetical protein